MDIYEAIGGRHSIRVFSSEPVARETLDRMLAAACAAPSAQNLQPWHFHVCTGGARDAVAEAMALSTVHLQEYIDVLPAEKIEAAERFFATLGGAPVVVVVSVPAGGDELTRINSYIATGAALENLMLAATAEGLSCCNITFSFWVRDHIAAVVGAGDDREIASLLLVGRAAEEPHATPRRADAVTFHE